MKCADCRKEIDESSSYKLDLWLYDTKIHTYHLCSSLCMALFGDHLNYISRRMQQRLELGPGDIYWDGVIYTLKDLEEVMYNKRLPDNVPQLGGDKKS